MQELHEIKLKRADTLTPQHEQMLLYHSLHVLLTLAHDTCKES